MFSLFLTIYTTIMALSNAARVKAENADPFTLNILVTFDARGVPFPFNNGAMMTGISNCVVKSFNGAHDTSIIELYSFDIDESMLLDRGSDTTSAGSYTVYGLGAGAIIDAPKLSNQVYSRSKWQS